MADSLTDELPLTEAALTLPEVGASADTWGGKLNANFDLIAEEAIALAALAGGAAQKASNLSDLASAATARTNLGLVIGTNVQAQNVALQSISGLTLGANTYIYFTASNTAAAGTVTAFARSLLDDADAATMRATLGLGQLGELPTINNSNWDGEDLAVANGGTGASTASAARNNLGLAIGTNVQAYHANLAAFAGLGFAANKVAAVNGGGSLALLDFTATGQSIAAAADAAAVKTLLSLNNVENKSSATIRGELSSGNVTTALGYTPTSITGLTGAQSTSAIKAGLSLSKSDVGLGNVDNKSSSTIRGEITKANVDAALGKTAARVNAGTAANSGLISWGTGAPPTLDEGQIYLRHA